ncbi:hypothetical protein TNCV_4335531 [Trichonephila clavipes]|uniref:Uncharacterized protein n=1 Tax=Trichonephila clavipes TaxID=2585209 RepID=A0A8X6RAJ4_TRICX|nr:hypothetical protein TNCV_4335531 [Trichonephila clavipes]
MGWSQADAARRFNVSRSALSSLKSISNRSICVQKTCSRATSSYNNCKRPFYRSFGPKEKKDFCAAACSIREKNIR